MRTLQTARHNLRRLWAGVGGAGVAATLLVGCSLAEGAPAEAEGDSLPGTASPSPSASPLWAPPTDLEPSERLAALEEALAVVEAPEGLESRPCEGEECEREVEGLLDDAEVSYEDDTVLDSQWIAPALEVRVSLFDSDGTAGSFVEGQIDSWRGLGTDTIDFPGEWVDESHTSFRPGIRGSGWSARVTRAAWSGMDLRATAVFVNPRPDADVSVLYDRAVFFAYSGPLAIECWANQYSAGVVREGLPGTAACAEVVDAVLVAAGERNGEG